MIKGVWRRITLGVATATIAITGLAGFATAAGVATAATASAATVTCKTLNVSAPAAQFAVHPHMTVPICYNGHQVWKNGHVTPGLSLIGYATDGFTWYGTYTNAGKTFLGVGENYEISLVIKGAPISWTCASRWLIGSGGKVYSYTRGC
jgi:hypothetical protein